jgi:hypothetical protein
MESRALVKCKSLNGVYSNGYVCLIEWVPGHLLRMHDGVNSKALFKCASMNGA